MLTLLEFVVRRRSQANGAQLAGLFVGDSIRLTLQPTATHRLEAFQEVSLTGLQERPRQLVMSHPLGSATAHPRPQNFLLGVHKVRCGLPQTTLGTGEPCVLSRRAKRDIGSCSYIPESFVVSIKIVGGSNP
jgi:hypothetical protein